MEQTHDFTIGEETRKNSVNCSIKSLSAFRFQKKLAKQEQASLQRVGA